MRPAPQDWPLNSSAMGGGTAVPHGCHTCCNPPTLLQKGLRPANKQSVSFHLTFRQMWAEGLLFKKSSVLCRTGMRGRQCSEMSRVEALSPRLPYPGLPSPRPTAKFLLLPVPRKPVLARTLGEELRACLGGLRQRGGTTPFGIVSRLPVHFHSLFPA